MNRATYSRLSRCSNVMGSSNTRITRDNLLTLRAAGLRENPVRQFLSRAASEISALVSSLFAVKSEKTNSMCKYYGHVIRGPWAGAFPKCYDCGHTITQPEQLRKAQPAS